MDDFETKLIAAIGVAPLSLQGTLQILLNQYRGLSRDAEPSAPSA